MIQIFLINLDRSKDRLKFVSARLNMLGLNFIRIEAVDGARLTEQERRAFIAERPRDGKRGWRDGQIGCFLSHKEAWTQIADKSDDYGLIIEDDLHLSDATPALLADNSWIPPDAEIVRLECTGQWLALDAPVASAIGRDLRRVRSSAWGAGAYLLSRKAAIYLLSVSTTLQSPVDDFLFNRQSSHTANSLTTYQIVPALAVQDKFSAKQAEVKGFGSDIEIDIINARLKGFAAFRRRITSKIRGKVPVDFV